MRLSICVAGVGTAAIDAVLARVFVCAIDEVDIYMHKQSPDASNEEALLATLVVCKDLFDQSLRAMARNAFNYSWWSGGSYGRRTCCTGAKHVPMTLLKHYWAALLARAEALEQGLSHRVPDGAQAF